jgi:hypothetical protein
LLREDHRIADMRHEDAARQHHPLGRPGEVRQDHDRIIGRRGATPERSVMHPDQIEAHGLGLDARAYQVRQLVGLARDPRDVVERNADANARVHVHVVSFNDIFSQLARLPPNRAGHCPSIA